MVVILAEIIHVDSCFCYDLKRGSVILGKCEIVIGSISVILFLVFYSVDIEALEIYPKMIWSSLAIVNRKSSIKLRFQ